MQKAFMTKSVVYSRMNQVELRPQYEATKVDGLVEPYDVIDTKAFHYLKKHCEEEKKDIFFFGYTQKSRHICKMLKEVGIEVTVYEIDAMTL